MASLFSRISKRVKSTARAFCADWSFSPKLAFLRIGDELVGRFGFESFSFSCNRKKNAYVSEYLKTKLAATIEKYADSDCIGEKSESAPIWVCWWTGEDTAPAIVKSCIASIRKNAGSHPVHFIDKSNASDYIDIPEYLTQKVESGSILVAHFADYVRIALLEKYGGLWLDATIFCSQTIPDECFEHPIFSLKSDYTEARFVSGYRWTGFCLGAWKGNAFYSFLKEAFEQYWSTEKAAIDYMFFDHLILIGLESVAAAKSYESLPNNNPHRDDLQLAMSKGLPAEEFDSILDPDTAIYKLSWREQYPTHNAAEALTVYGKFILAE